MLYAHFFFLLAKEHRPSIVTTFITSLGQESRRGPQGHMLGGPAVSTKVTSQV